MQTLDYYARRMVAWPLALIGLLLTDVSALLINTAAWIADVDPNDDTQSL